MKFESQKDDFVFSELNDKGWVLFHSQDSDLDNYLVQISHKLGMPMGVRVKSKTIEIIKPTSAASSHPQSLSHLFGLDEFPLHCDTAHWLIPGNYIVLGCKNPGICGRKTVLLDWREVDFPEDLLVLLKYAVFLFRNGKNSFFSSILSNQNKFFRYDPGCMYPTDNKSKETLEALSEYFSKIEKVEIEWKKDSILIINNWNLLHGRSLPHHISKDYSNRELHRIIVK